MPSLARPKLFWKRLRVSGHLIGRPDSLILQVEAYLDSFRYEEVVELCLQAVEREPDSVTILEEVGPLLLELGHVDHAHKVCQSRDPLTAMCDTATLSC